MENCTTDVLENHPVHLFLRLITKRKMSYISRRFTEEHQPKCTHAEKYIASSINMSYRSKNEIIDLCSLIKSLFSLYNNIITLMNYITRF